MKISGNKSFYVLFFSCMLFSCEPMLLITQFYDETPPQIASTQPAPNSTAQPRNLKIFITFDDPVLTNCLAATPLSLVHSGSNTVVPATLKIDSEGRRLVLIPAHELQSFTNYEVRLTTALSNVVGLPLAAPMSFTFATGDSLTNTGPTIFFLYPTNRQEVYGEFAIGMQIISPGIPVASLGYSINGTHVGAISVNETENYVLDIDPEAFPIDTLLVAGSNCITITAVDGQSNTNAASISVLSSKPIEGRNIDRIHIQHAPLNGGYSDIMRWKKCDSTGGNLVYLTTPGTALLYCEDYTCLLNEPNVIEPGDFFLTDGIESSSGPFLLILTFRNSTTGIVDQIQMLLSGTQDLVGSTSLYRPFKYDGKNVILEKK